MLPGLRPRTAPCHSAWSVVCPVGAMSVTEATRPSRIAARFGRVSHVTAEMRSVVGRETGRRTSFPVSESDIRRWALAVYWPHPPPRLFWDAEYALETGHEGIVAPEEFNPFAWMVAEGPADAVPNDLDRVERMLGVEGPGLRFEVNGGLEVRYGARMRAGDVITSVSRLGGYTERPGRFGLMLFTVVEDTWTNQDGKMVKQSNLTQIRY